MLMRKGFLLALGIWLLALPLKGQEDAGGGAYAPAEIAPPSSDSGEVQVLPVNPAPVRVAKKSKPHSRAKAKKNTRRAKLRSKVVKRAVAAPKIQAKVEGREAAFPPVPLTPVDPPNP